jgi:Uma2 family endonuclease
MKSVLALVPPEIIEQRKRTGQYARDEVWEGVLHMSPEADTEHQDFEGSLENWLRRYWSLPRMRKVYHRINLAREGAGRNWINDFRIPDLVMLTADRFDIDHRTHFEGGPEVVVEIRSPNDESEKKLPFYAALNVLEVWVIDRDTKQPELYLLRDGHYEPIGVGSDGWARSPFTGVEMRIGRPGKLAIRVGDDESTREELPEE